MTDFRPWEKENTCEDSNSARFTLETASVYEPDLLIDVDANMLLIDVWVNGRHANTLMNRDTAIDLARTILTTMGADDAT